MKIYVEDRGVNDDTISFEVKVEESKFSVTSDCAYIRALVGNNVDYSEFVKKTFEFLLEREPKEAILKSFDISVIKKYFPDYEDFMKERYKQS